MADLFGDISQIIQHNPWLAFPAVFIGGVTTASNPCVLAMVPLLMSVVAGREKATNLRQSLIFSLLFITGLSITFTALGLISALMGRLFGDVGGFWKYLVAAVCLVMGLHLLGLLRFSFNLPRPVNVRTGGPLGAFLLGLLFGVVSTPCAVPILAVLLAYVGSRGNVVYGGLLLLIYALGHSALILVAGTSMGAAKRLIDSKGLRRTNWALQKVAGVVIILVGAYFLFRL
jgi:cytochrome c biogenesis protein CcdA